MVLQAFMCLASSWLGLPVVSAGRNLGGIVQHITQVKAQLAVLDFGFLNDQTNYHVLISFKVTGRWI